MNVWLLLGRQQEGRTWRGDTQYWKKIYCKSNCCFCTCRN